MKTRILTTAFVLFSITLFAQEFTIKGTLTDAESGVPLESATVFAERPRDSTLVTYTISDKNGAFELIGDYGNSDVNVNVSYIGYTDYLKKVNLAKNRNIDLGKIKLSESTEQLDGIVLKGYRAPITIKKDTLEFNVASFKTKKDATVEDLLKELPGVEVDAEGNITVNGKAVNKILVNGKPFFGDDPTIATRNLTKEIIDKIQVVDTKTDAEAFTDEAGESEEKTINITIDEEKNKGVFGRVAAGGGTDDRFEYAGLLNYFNNDVRLSVLGGGNNTNSPGFSFGELNKMFGGARYISTSDNGGINFGGRQFGGGQGITNSRVGGANFADEWGEETDISADYFYSASNSFNDVIRNRENILPDNRFVSNSTSSTRSATDSHNVNLNFKTEIDSTFQISIRPQFRYTEGQNTFNNDEASTSLDGTLTNQSTQDQRTESSSRFFQNNLELTKRYGAKGGYVRLSVRNEINDDVSDAFNLSTVEIFGDTPQTINRDQRTDGNQESNQYTVTAKWRIPIIDKTLFIEPQYRYQSNTRNDIQSVFDFDEVSQQFANFNLEQSTDFENIDRSARPEMRISYKNDKSQISANAGYVMRTLKSDDALRNIQFENDFNALELGLRGNHQFSDKTSMYGGYNLRNRAPSVGQLSPFVNVSNPLNIRTGNPDLKPSNNHSIYGGFNNYDFQTRSGIYSYLGANFTNDQVVSQTTTDENFVRSTTYTNVDGQYNFYASIGFNKQKKLDSIRTIKYNLNINTNADRSVNFNNDIQYASRTISYGPEVGVGFTWDELFEISPSYQFNYSNNTFNIPLFENQNYRNHIARLRTSLTVPKALEWSNDISYNYNPDVAEDFQQSAVFWNSSIAYSILKDTAVITLKAFDLLAQNTNAERTSTQDYIQDVQSTVLERYFLLSFSYKFNTLGKKGETNDNSWFD